MTVVAVTERNLHEIADSIWESYERGKQGHMQAVESYFAIGRDLLEARRRFPSDNDFGEWFAGQSFPFNRQWAWTLRAAAEREGEVREVVATQVVTGQPNIKKAVQQVRRPRLSSVPESVEEHPIEYSTATWADLAGLIESLEGLLTRDASTIAEAVPSRRRATTAKRLRKLGTGLGRIAWTLEGMEATNGDSV